MRVSGNELRRARVLVLAVAVAAVAAPAPAVAAPADRAQAVALWKRIDDGTAVAAGWTGTTASCVVGTESQQSLDATLTAVNALREYAGLAPVSLDASKNRQALAAATMMAAAGRLSHDPDPGWPCYTEEGAAGARSSNLFLGLSGAAAMVGYVADENVPSLGHRRWLLSPYASTFGTGSTGRSNALHVTPGGELPPKGPAPEVLAWPPGGFVPWRLVFDDWSAQFELPGDVDLSGARVSVRVDGSARAVSGLRSLEASYGRGGPLLAWNVATAAADADADRTIEVTIAGVRVDGLERTFGYVVRAVDVEPPSIQGASVAPRRGRIRVGRTLAARTVVRHASVVAFQWLRGSQPIPGATSRTYRVRAADRGRRIRCRITATNAGGASTTRTTPSVLVSRR